MPGALPSTGVLQAVFSAANPSSGFKSNASEAPRRSKYEARTELYGAWSAVDDAKDKANQLSNAAVKEFEKASSAAQAKTGKIELYSAKYYASCIFGGLLACVSTVIAHAETCC
jgi:solute carrier family 25 (mitochondrial phosphate transporter), member 3